MASSTSKPSSSTPSEQPAVTIRENLPFTEFIPGPENKEEQLEIWQSQVLIPFQIKDSKSAFLGPHCPPKLLDHVSSFFPNSEEKILAFEDSIRVDILTPTYRVFRSSPPVGNGRTWFDKWVCRIEVHKAESWKKIGIFDLIQLTKRQMPYNMGLLTSSFFFWDVNTNSFHTRYGMISPTLYDMAFLTGLPPTGETYLPDMIPTVSISGIDLSNKTYSAFVKRNMGTGDSVSEGEHVAFLMYWLCAFIFCTKSLQVAMAYQDLAILLHLEKPLCLSKLLLATLYDSLREGVQCIKTEQVVTNVAGPFWLLQMWLNAIFEKHLRYTGPDPPPVELGGSIYTFFHAP